MKRMELVTAKELCYRYKGEKQEALKGVTLDVRPGEVLGLLGPDGAGKTTLLRLMAGVLLPTGGQLEVLGGRPVQDHRTLSCRMGYMPQRFSLYEDLSVRDNLSLYARLHGIDKREAARQGEMLLQAAGLSCFQERLAGKLSGGMKQKLALICALYGEPPLLLLDEPGVGVDPLSRRELWALVEQARSGRRGIVWATAYLDEAARCDRVCILHEGRAPYLGSPDALLEGLRGRVYSCRSASMDALTSWRSLSSRPDVLEVTRKGTELRLILRERPQPGEEPAGALPVEPTFEEAFIHLLGLGQVQKPPVAPPPDTAGAEEVLVTEGLTRRFGTFTATDRLSIRVRRGEIFGLLGGNGAGKTTAFRMMCGLLRPTEGRAEILGIDLNQDARHARAHIGYMAQKFSLYSHLTVRQNLLFFASVYGLKGALKKERLEEGIQRHGLAPYLRHVAGTLPLGLKQRLSMACATLHEPEFLFLDEPTSGVDPFTRRAFWADINAMSARGVTIIVTTHFMDEAQYLHRMVIMDKGRVIVEGSPEELKARAATSAHPEPDMEDVFIHFLQQGAAP